MGISIHFGCLWTHWCCAVVFTWARGVSSPSCQCEWAQWGPEVVSCTGAQSNPLAPGSTMPGPPGRTGTCGWHRTGTQIAGPELGAAAMTGGTADNGSPERSAMAEALTNKSPGRSVVAEPVTSGRPGRSTMVDPVTFVGLLWQNQRVMGALGDLLRERQWPFRALSDLLWQTH